MKFRVTKASDWDYKENIEIATLEELVDFIKTNGDVVINEGDETEMYMVVYDDYIEGEMRP